MPSLGHHTLYAVSHPTQSGSSRPRIACGEGVLLLLVPFCSSQTNTFVLPGRRHGHAGERVIFVSVASSLCAPGGIVRLDSDFDILLGEEVLPIVVRLGIDAHPTALGLGALP